MTRREFLFLTACLTAAGTGTRLLAQAPRPGFLEYLEELVERGIAPGASLIASRDGRVMMRQVAGTCCRADDREAAVTPDTIFPLFSFSKVITGTIVAMAVSEGLLDYDDRISQHIPEFRGGGKEEITLRHCLTHAAGLNKMEPGRVGDAPGWNATLEKLCAAEVEWEPGSRTVYHAWTGSFLAAECVRRVYGGLPWEDLCRQKLFEPLGVSSMTFELPTGASPVAIIPIPAPGKPVAPLYGSGQPGAGCFGTLEDALTVLHFHLQNGIWNSRALISPEVFREMHRIQYAAEIAAALAAGTAPLHEPWGLGPLLRGPHPAADSHRWFGFANQSPPGIFGHAGISSLTAVADPQSGLALVFSATHAMQPATTTIEVRNEVTDRVFAALAP